MPQTSIDAAAENYAAQLAHLHPLTASELGIPGYADKMPDYSPEGAAAVDQLNAAMLMRLTRLEPENSQDVITRNAMQERLSIERQLYATGVVELNNIASPVQEIRSTFDLMPHKTHQDWENIARRLSQVKDALQGYRSRLTLAVADGHVPPVRQVDACVLQSEAAARGFFATLIKQPIDVPVSLLRDLEHGAASAAQAYTEFAEYLANDLRRNARLADPVGADYYTLVSKQFLGAEIDLLETYHWGLEELERIVDEQQHIAESIQPGASIDQARALLTADPARQLHGTQALQAWMQHIADATIQNMKQHFSIPEPMDRIEALIAPTHDGGIYYTGPSEDFSRPGRMWWSVPESEETFSTWQQTTTVFHEGVPGHHLQIATTILNTENLNTWRRNWLWVSGHGEGWALYAEELMHELGYLTDPGDYFGMLDAQRMRAARVVFDIGVHCGFNAPKSRGGKPWDVATGYAFLKDHFNESSGVLDFEFTRYLGWPGQAPSYTVGKHIWQNIRAEHEKQTGFNLKTFHTRALALGSMGLDTLQKALQ